MPVGKKECPSCHEFIGTRSFVCQCGFKFPIKEKKPIAKKVLKPKKSPKPSKTKILAGLVIKPKDNRRLFYRKEMKFLNDLCDKYSLEFMNIVSFPKKYDSLAYLLSPKLKETLDRKFRAFNYVVDKSKYPTYNIGEKFGEDKEIKKKRKTIKDFLDE